MTYRVIFTPQAGAGPKDSLPLPLQSGAARGSRLGQVRATKREEYARHPERCSLAPESTSFDEPVRELFFGAGNRGTYRFLFVVLDQSVYLLHVRHGSMLPLSTPEE